MNCNTTHYRANSSSVPGDPTKTTDGGETWTELSRRPGLPAYPWGRVGVTVSPVRPSRVYAIIEAKDGGLFRSDDAGSTWALVNGTRTVRDRPWYYSRVHADPKNADKLYVLTTMLVVSTDAGKTANAMPFNGAHPDFHDLWIAPNDPARMIAGNDGGAVVTEDTARSWTEADQATTQFYVVATTNHFPYHVCGAAQDNGTHCAPSRHPNGISSAEWYTAGNSESGGLTAHPLEPDITYTSNCCGELHRKDRLTQLSREIGPLAGGQGWGSRPAKDVPHRYNWVSPLVVHPREPNTLFYAAHKLFRTTDEGQSWTVISPDLTRNDPATTGPSGGPITEENVSQEWYATIISVAPSPVATGVIWAGSDDGLLHVTRDGGGHWTNVTPPGLAPASAMAWVEASPHSAGAAYVAISRRMVDDFTPYLYKTTDYGATWSRIDAALPPNVPLRVVRADSARKGLLFVGSERTVSVSLDDGASWAALNGGLPNAPITGLVIKDADLVVSTFGRAFWILDDITPLRQLTASEAPLRLFRPNDAVRVSWGQPFQGFDQHPIAANPPSGIVIDYWLATAADSVSIEVVDSKGTMAARVNSRRDSTQVTARSGLNRYVWDMRYQDLTSAGPVAWGAGPTAIPGTYTIRVTAAGKTVTAPARLLPDPRVKATARTLQTQFDLARSAWEVSKAIAKADREVSALAEEIGKRRASLAGKPELREFEQAAERLVAALAMAGDSLATNREPPPTKFGTPYNPRFRFMLLSMSIDQATAAPPTTQVVKAVGDAAAHARRLISDLWKQVDAELPKVNDVLTRAGSKALER